MTLALGTAYVRRPRRENMRTFLYLIVITCLCFATSVAADERTEAQRHYVKGTKAFDLGAYDEAIAEYSSAYRIKDDPALLYNLGQAHRLANHPVEAIHFYKMYLTKVPNAPNRDEVVAKVSDLQATLEQRRRAEQQERQATAVVTTPVAPATSPAAAPVVAPPPATAPNDRSGRTLTITGAAMVGVGVATIAGGIACGVLAKQSSDDLTKAAETMQPFDSSKQRAGKTEQALEGALLGVGGAAAVTGIVLLLVGHAKAPGRMRATIVPTANARSVTLLTTMSF